MCWGGALPHQHSWVPKEPPPPPPPPGWASCKFLLQAVGGGGVDFAGKIWLFAMRCNSSALFPDADSRAWLIWKGGGGDWGCSPIHRSAPAALTPLPIPLSIRSPFCGGGDVKGAGGSQKADLGVVGGCPHGWVRPDTPSSHLRSR